MSLMNQKLFTIDGYNSKEYAFNNNDEYYGKTLQHTIMEFARAFIADISHPIFIIDSETNRIIYANEAATPVQGEYDLVGEQFKAAVQVFAKDITDESIAFFNRQWYNLKEKSFEWENSTFLIKELQPRPGVPDQDTLETWKNMIAVMLHRFRSPLTGMTGYLDMMEDQSQNESHKKWFALINKGIDHLYNMMDEMEALYNIPANYNDSKSSETDAVAIINNIILNLPSEIQKKIAFEQADENITFTCNPLNLKQIINVLLKNALEHSANENEPIQITINANRYIQISNPGKVIPDSIRKNIFHPFVTSKANNLGIGLTMALLYAYQFGGSVFLTRNSEECGISFTLCFPN
ncbi:MAG: HAMP domain-containing histidine kinase [Balneolaceae bacterium]|nr:HAMP domain-containing histidine kinase [Balneolaceae bacterium]